MAFILSERLIMLLRKIFLMVSFSLTIQNTLGMQLESEQINLDVRSPEKLIESTHSFIQNECKKHGVDCCTQGMFFYSLCGDIVDYLISKDVMLSLFLNERNQNVLHLCLDNLFLTQVFIEVAAQLADLLDVVITKDWQGNTPLHYAVRYADCKVFRSFLSHQTMYAYDLGIVFSSQNNYGNTVLTEAALYNNSLAIKCCFNHIKNKGSAKSLVLMRNKSRANKEESGYSVLFYLARSGDYDSVVEVLSAAGDKVQELVMMKFELNTNVLHAAALGGSADVCKAILDAAGQAKQALLCAQVGGSDGNTPLHIAVRVGVFAVVEQLIVGAGDRVLDLLKIKNIGGQYSGDTPLDIARTYAATEIDQSGDRWRIFEYISSLLRPKPVVAQIEDRSSKFSAPIAYENLIQFKKVICLVDTSPNCCRILPVLWIIRGNSSVVEHCLAKARVAGSNPVSRSIFLKQKLLFDCTAR